MKLSVLLPTRNGAPHVRHCIESVLAQPTDQIELVISDNASDDDTPQIIAEYSAEPRIKHRRLDVAVPVTDNWNAALEISSGEYVVLLGDDDALLPWYCERLFELIDRYKPDCLFTGAFGFAFPGAVADNTLSYSTDQFFSFPSGLNQTGPIDASTRRRMLQSVFKFQPMVPLNMQTTVVARHALERLPYGLFRSAYPDHYAINALLANSQSSDSWAVTPEPLVVVGVSATSYSTTWFKRADQTGKSYLGVDWEFPGQLPGNDILNGMQSWLRLLKSDFPSQLSDIGISRSDYVLRQMYAWLLQRMNGTLSWRELLQRTRLLATGDWLRLPFSLIKPRNAREAIAFARRTIRQRGTGVNAWWPGLEPVPNTDEIGGFVELIASQHDST